MSVWVVLPGRDAGHTMRHCAYFNECIKDKAEDRRAESRNEGGV